MLADTATQLKAINADQAKLQANVATAQHALADVRAQYTAMVTQVGDLDAALSTLDSKIAAGQQQLADERATLASAHR